MYKLIIGNVRISVMNDDIKREEATSAAKKAIAAASQRSKLLSHVEVNTGPNGLEVTTTEKIGAKVTRKTIKQSMLDGVYTSAREKFFPTSAFSQKDSWFDGDTGQEWSGEAVRVAREEVLKELEVWIKSVK